MPHTQSAKKRLRQNKKRQAHNREIKKDIKIQTKKFLRAVDAGNQDEMKTELAQCARILDKAGSRRIIHPNKAARRKSQLARLLNSKTQAQA